jgi:hypothetical protein
VAEAEKSSLRVVEFFNRRLIGHGLERRSCVKFPSRGQRQQN